jgi:hypothetical protein
MIAKLVKENIGNILKPKSEEDIIKYLSNLSKEDKDKKLIDASIDGRQDAVKLLIKCGANINAKNNYGSTALMYASETGHIEVVKLLIEAGANVNVKNKSESTALIYAAGNNRINIIEILLKAGADINAKNKYGTTALVGAYENNNKDIVDLLKRYGAKDVNESLNNILKPKSEEEIYKNIEENIKIENEEDATKYLSAGIKIKLLPLVKYSVEKGAKILDYYGSHSSGKLWVAYNTDNSESIQDIIIYLIQNINIKKLFIKNSEFRQYLIYKTLYMGMEKVMKWILKNYEIYITKYDISFILYNEWPTSMWKNYDKVKEFFQNWHIKKLKKDES